MVVQEWIVFKEVFHMKSDGTPKFKTKRFNVVSKIGENILGNIQWYPSWRHYCFFPNIDFQTVHSDRCLLSISEFITKLNIQYKGGNGLPPTSKDVGIRPTIL